MWLSPSGSVEDWEDFELEKEVPGEVPTVEFKRLDWLALDRLEIEGLEALRSRGNSVKNRSTWREPHRGATSAADLPDSDSRVPMNLDKSVLRCFERGLREDEQFDEAGTTMSGAMSLVLRLGGAGCGESIGGVISEVFVEPAALELCRSLLCRRFEDLSSAADTISHSSPTSTTGLPNKQHAAARCTRQRRVGKKS